MTIIKDGVEHSIPVKQFECAYCSCMFDANRNDKHNDVHIDYVVCPCCEMIIDWECGKRLN